MGGTWLWYGVRAIVGGSEADRHRRLGKANGGGELTAEWKRANTVGVAGGGGESENVAVKDSL